MHSHNEDPLSGSFWFNVLYWDLLLILLLLIEYFRQLTTSSPHFAHVSIIGTKSHLMSYDNETHGRPPEIHSFIIE